MKIVFLGETSSFTEMAWVFLASRDPKLPKTMQRNETNFILSWLFVYWFFTGFILFGNKFNEPSSFEIVGKWKLNENFASAENRGRIYLYIRNKWNIWRLGIKSFIWSPIFPQQQPLIKRNSNSLRFLAFNDGNYALCINIIGHIKFLNALNEFLSVEFMKWWFY